MMLTALSLILPLIAEGAVEVHKCRDAKGGIVYTDQPCAKDSAAMAMPNEPLKDAPVNWVCEVQPDKNDAKLKLEDLSQVQQQSYLATGYGDGFFRVQNARKFEINGSFYLCDETKGRSPSQLVEMVITPEGHAWMRRDGRVTHQSPASSEKVPEIKPAK